MKDIAILRMINFENNPEILKAIIKKFILIAENFSYRKNLYNYTSAFKAVDDFRNDILKMKINCLN